MKSVKAFTAVFLILLLLAAVNLPVQATSFWSGQDSRDASSGGRWPTVSEIEGKAWLVLDCQTGNVLLAHEADTAEYPASTTKIMTAVLVLESSQMDLDRVVTVSATAVKLPAGSSKAGFLAGEQVAVRDVLAGLMLASGNDAANVLAEAYSGSIAAFAEVMNQKAAALGLTGSHFCNPSGLHDEAHVMTARDMASLTAYALKNAKFRDLVSTCAYSMPATNLHPYPGWAMYNNTNRFLQFGKTALQSDWLDHYEGIKTGSTDAAGNNLVAAAVTRTGHELVSVIFGVPLASKAGNPFIYSRTLLEAAAQIIAVSSATTGGTTAGSPATQPAATTGAAAAATDAAAPTGTGMGNTSAAGLELTGFFLDNPWRSAFLILLPVTLLITLLSGVFYRQARRLRLRPKRVRRV